MQSTLEPALAWWNTGPILGLVIVSFLAPANKRFGVLGGVSDPRTFHAMLSLDSQCAYLLLALGAGRVLALAVAAGLLVGVELQPTLARAAERATEQVESPIPAIQGADFV